MGTQENTINPAFTSVILIYDMFTHSITCYRTGDISVRHINDDRYRNE